jgi:hypothetical protein
MAALRMTSRKYIMPDSSMERHYLFFACVLQAALPYPLGISITNHQSAIDNRQSAIIAGLGCGHRAALCYLACLA